MQMSIWVFTVIMTNKRGAWKHSKNIPGRLRADGDWAVAGGPMTSWWSLPVQRNLDPGWDPDDGELHQLPFSAELGFGEIHLRVLSHEPAAATRDTRQCCHRSHTKRRRHRDRSRASRSGRREASSKHAHCIRWPTLPAAGCDAKSNTLVSMPVAEGYLPHALKPLWTTPIKNTLKLQHSFLFPFYWWFKWAFPPNQTRIPLLLRPWHKWCILLYSDPR